MAGTKKRKDLVQSSTLHDFFVPPVKKTKWRSAAPKSMKRVITRGIPVEDIIVISDDEEPERDELRSMSGTSCCTAADLKLKTFVPGSPVVKIEDKRVTPDVRPESDPSLGESGAHELASDSVMGFSNEPRDFEPPRCGDWAMGDDEDPFRQEEEEEEEGDKEDTGADPEEPQIQLCKGKYPDADNACPVCGQELNRLSNTDVDRHVNSCIDALSDSPSPVKPPVEKHTPLSTVQAPFWQATTSLSAKATSAFSVLMSSYKAHDAWKEASEAENKKGSTGRRRPAPFYKVMQGMPIAVDAFRYGKIPGVTAYFLTHAHSDHYTNLSHSWKHGPIYCSQTTANLIIHMLGVDPKWVHPLPMDLPTVVPDTGDVDVTLIQANHCPGSVLFLFRGRQTVNAGDSTFRSPFVGSQRIFRYLHCGDFRACPQHVLHSEIKGKKIDTVYLDTTYLNPKYCFPPQPLVISACTELALQIVNGNSAPGPCDEKPINGRKLLTEWVTVSDKGKEKGTGRDVPKQERVLIVVGTYTIGKERIIKAIARALSTKVYCDMRKAAVLRCLSDPELHAMLTDDPFAAGVHVVPLHVINSDTFKDYLSRWNGHWSRAVGFRPTGWAYTPPTGVDTLPNVSHVIAQGQARNFTYAHLRPMRNSTPTLMIYGVPYSEHSSFFELTCFALSLDWGKMIATVNVGSLKSRATMAKWFERWQAERNRREKSSAECIVKYRQPDYW